MTKVKSKEFISSDSDSDSDDDVQTESAKSEPKGEKRKSTDLVLEDKSKKQKTDSDEVPKKKEPEKKTKKESESESESSDEETKKPEPEKKEPEKNTNKLSASESESSDEEEKKRKKKAKKEKKKKSKEKSDSKEGGSKKKEKKKAPKTTVARKPEGNARKGFDLGRDRKISVTEFKGRRYVNIREYYDAGGEMKPGRKGVSLTREQWDMLTQVKDEVNQAVVSDDKFWDLGRNKRVSLNEFRGNVLFDIREYYDAQGQMKPGKKGIALSREEWNAIHAVDEEITEAII